VGPTHQDAKQLALIADSVLPIAVRQAAAAMTLGKLGAPAKEDTIAPLVGLRAPNVCAVALATSRARLVCAAWKAPRHVRRKRFNRAAAGDPKGTDGQDRALQHSHRKDLARDL
jgi:hypothetical protein